ncbi:MAG: hypothetical protein KDK70_13155 [Myxococcales bacterium]|nr:hypothetical protein [Myxococcales bacterium]
MLALGDAATTLLEARRSLHSGRLRLPCTLATVGLDALQRATYVGLMPGVGEPDGPVEPDGMALVERELWPVLRDLEDRRDDHGAILQALARACVRMPSHAGLRALHRIASTP